MGRLHVKERGKSAGAASLVKFKVRVGDQVVIVAGRDKGKVGEILAIDRIRGRVKVKGGCMSVRHQKPSEANPEGGRMRQEASLHISNVMHVDPQTKKPVRVRVERRDAGVRALVAKGSNLEVRVL